MAMLIIVGSITMLCIVGSITMLCIVGSVATPASAGDFATKDDAVALVHKAIALVTEVGMEKAKPDLMDHSGHFIDRDLYMIVIDKDGVRVVHGQNPKLVGKTYYDAIDVTGKAYGEVVRQISEGSGKGWFSFTFKDPVTGKLLPKENYVERAGDYTCLAGVYMR
jgi:cytochrome c